MQESVIVESTGLYIDVIKSAYRLKSELSVGVLAVRDFVDGGRRCRWRTYSCSRNSPTFTTPS